MKDIVIEECCDIVSWHTNIFKKEIEMSKDKKIKLDMMDISKLIWSDTIIEKRHSEEICLKLKDILSNKGIDATIDEYDDGEKFLILREWEIPVIYKPKPIKMVNGEEKKSFLDILKDNKLYDEETKYLLCSECYRYCVRYLYTSEKWWCNHCIANITYHNHNLDISDKDKYHIYKLWGADALSTFTNESMKNTVKFVASYFRNCCVSKKDKCLYFDFFKEKEGKMVDIEGDVIDERSEMGIVRRNARSE